MKQLNTRQWLQLILLIIAVLSWLLRTTGVLYIPGLTGITLGLALGMVSIGFIAQKDKTKKIVGVLVLAFALLNILTAFFEVTGLISAV